MLTDLRDAVRGFRRTPGVAAVAIVVLTLAIGAGIVTFAVVDTVVIRALPFDEESRLIAIGNVRIRDPRFGPVAFQDYLAWREAGDVFAGLAAVGGQYTVAEPGRPGPLFVLRASAELFGVLRVQPILGRTFGPEHEVGERSRVAVIGYALWQRRFGGDPAVVGQSMTLGGSSYEILGVMPRGFTYPVGTPTPTEIWVPFAPPADERRPGSPARIAYLQVVGRLRDGVALEQARARVEQIFAAQANANPTLYAGRRARIVPLRESLVTDVSGWMILLLAAVGLVLMIACVNVASLLLARASARSREIAVRTALGAPRWRLIRALLVESLLLAAVSVALGALVALWMLDVVKAAMPAGIARSSAIAMDLRVMTVMAAAATLTTLTFGLIPAWQTSQTEPAAVLNELGRSATTGRARRVWLSALVSVEIAFAVVLLVATGLFVSSFVRVINVDLGFDRTHLAAFSIAAPQSAAPTESDRVRAGRQFLADVADRVRQVPGVIGVGLMQGGLPLAGDFSGYAVTIVGGPQPPAGGNFVDGRRATPEYFRVAGIKLLRGRFFTEADAAGAPGAAILNDVAAARLFEGRDALGARIDFLGPRTVVGIVQGVRPFGPESDVRPEGYVPTAQAGGANGDLVVRTAGSPEALVKTIGAAIATMLPAGQPAPEARILETDFRRLTAGRRFSALIMSLFGILAIVIAAAGVFGVMACVVAQRAPEIGIRMALGATADRILRMVLGRALTLLTAGLLPGLAAAWSLARVVESMLFQVLPHDPVVYGATGVLLLLVGLLAAMVPARRASRVDPLVVLRQERRWL